MNDLTIKFRNFQPHPLSDLQYRKSAVFMGVDWVGMSRGDITKRDGSVIYARLSTVELSPY